MGAVLDNSNVQGRDSDEPDSRPVYIPERQAMNPTILRGELYFANLDPCVGSEQGGTRPVLIIQNNIGNQHSDTTIVAAITGRRKPGLPTHVLVPKSIGLREDSTILLEQLRTIDEMRLGQKIGALSKEQIRLVDIALMTSLGMHGIHDRSMVMTLCRSCTQAFRDSNGYILRRADFRQETREPCMLCNARTGYDFEIIRL